MDIEYLLIGKDTVVQEWYRWGTFVGLGVAVIAAIWIFYDAARRTLEATLWKALSVAAAILIIPSIVFRLDPSLAYLRLPTAITPVAYLGLVATVISLISVALYTAGVGVKPVYVCPNCGRALDPSWDRCPYCAPPEPSPHPPVPEPTRPIGEPEPVGLGPTPQAPKTEILVKAPPQLAWLVVISGPRTGKEFRLGEVTGIGRDPTQNDVVIDDPAMSRQHAKVKLEEGQFVIYDLASSNGTFVNDQRIYRQALVNGDTVKLGETTFTFMELKEKKEEERGKKKRRREED